MMKKKAIKALATALIICLTGLSLPCNAAVPALSGQGSVPLVISEKAYYSYTLGSGDLLDIHIIVGDNALSLDYPLLISSAGTIYFPNIGPIKLTGLTIKQAEDKIRATISRRFTEPFAMTIVLNQPRMTRVFYGGDEYMPTLKNLEQYVYVYGEVSRSGRFNYFEGKKLSDYLNLAGGPSGRANLGGTTVTRTLDGKPQVYTINASDILFKGVKTNDIQILEGDIINVPGNFFYFSDFASFANTVMLGITLFYTVQNFIKR